MFIEASFPSFESLHLMMNYYYHYHQKRNVCSFSIEIKLDFGSMLYYLNGVINRARLFDERVFIFRKVSKINEANERSSLYGNFDDSRLASRAIASNDPRTVDGRRIVRSPGRDFFSTTTNRDFKEPWELPGTITRQPIPFSAILFNSKRTMSNWQAARWLLMNRRSASRLAFRG